MRGRRSIQDNETLTIPLENRNEAFSVNTKTWDKRTLCQNLICKIRLTMPLDGHWFVRPVGGLIVS